MFDDTVTLFTHIGDDAEGRARYHKTIVDRALVRISDGVKQYPARNLEGDDRATVYFWVGRCLAGPQFVLAEQFDEAARERGCFTVRADGRDMLFYGATTDETPPESPGTYRIVGVSVNTRGSERVSHVMLRCR